MKFAKVLQQTLVEDDIPEEWVEAAIKYKVLKKCIARVVRELEFLGLPKADLKLLLQDEDKMVEVDQSETTPNNPIVAQYTLRKRNNKIVPFLKIILNDTDTKQYTEDHVQEVAAEIRGKLKSVLSTDDDDHHVIEIKEEENQLVLLPTTSHRETEVEDIVKVENKNEIIIMLNSDSKFFKMLNSELESLDHIRDYEETQLVAEIEHLTDQITLVTKRRLDLYNWRELFRIYLDSEVFFRYNETKFALLQRTAGQVKANLSDFESRIEKAKVMDRFKRKLLEAAYRDFMAVNERLLKIIQFQTINTTALRKILKKFDKRTSLNISDKFPQLISEDHIFINGSSVAQSICYVMQNKLLTVVPQLENYTCPICLSVAFKPIRLACSHIFCVRCLVKLKQRGKTNCPMCRYENAIELADSSNLDLAAMELIKKNFPLEVKEKLKEIDKERYEELVGKKNCVIV